MKKVSKRIAIAMLVLGGLSLTSVNAQQGSTVSTPCGTYEIENTTVKSTTVSTSGNATVTTSSSSSDVSVNSSTSNGQTTTKIYVNGKLVKQVTCEAKAVSPKELELEPIDFPGFDNDWFSDFSSFFSF